MKGDDDEDNRFVTVRAQVNERAMQQFAKNFTPGVEFIRTEKAYEFSVAKRLTLK